jgi:hypothetical protein
MQETTMTHESSSADHDDILDSIWHGCAWAAYLDQMAEERHWPPDSEATRRRAYAYYDEALAEKNAKKVGRSP